MDLNDGSGNIIKQKFLTGMKPKIYYVPSRTGYNFIGWNTKANGTGISYSSGSNYTTEQNGGTVILYAQWKSTAIANIVGYYAYPANKYSNITYGEDYFNFDIKCVNGCEKLNIPINGLIVGNNYKISFTRYYEGGFNNNSSNFGCKMSSSIISQTISKIKDLSFNSITTGTIQGSFSFYASSSTMYWVWDLSRLKDKELGRIRLYNILIEKQ